jgi:3-deoxy-D-manno-octulosonic acid (KDO) 8-phosphate synthase
MMRQQRQLPSSNKYRSRFEASVASFLTERGATFSYESLRLDYVRKCKYTPDFVLPNGVIIEVKGRWLGSDRTKHLRVRETNPDVDIRFCFQNAYNKLNKNSTTSYADWCDKHGFLWCHKIIPEEWLN